MSYQEQVQQAATALVRGEDANWELARLTYENTSRYRGEVGKVSLAAWAADVQGASGRRFGEDAAWEYRAVWERFGGADSDDHRGLSWTEAIYERRPGKAGEASRAGIVERALFREDSPPEAKREAYIRLAADPVVRAAVSEIGSPEAQAASNLMAAAARDVRTRAERNEREDPVLRRIDQSDALIDLEEAMRESAERIRRALVRISATTPTDPVGNRVLLERALEGLQEMVQAVESYLRHGKTDLDSFLASVLNGGD